MVRPRVSRKSVDIVLKYTAEALGGALFARFGLPFPPIVAGLPFELPQLRITSQQTDLLFLLADGSILHLEFQTTRRSGDLARFAAYHLNVYQRYGRPVRTIVLYGAGIRSASDTLDTGAGAGAPVSRTSSSVRKTETPRCAGCTRRWRAANRSRKPTAST